LKGIGQLMHTAKETFFWNLWKFDRVKYTFLS